MNLGLDSIECDCGSRIEAAKLPAPPNAAPYQTEVTSVEAFNLIRQAFIAGDATALADYNGKEVVKPVAVAAMSCAQKIFGGYCNKFIAVELVIDDVPRKQLYPLDVYNILREEDRPPVVDQYGVSAVNVSPRCV